MPRSCVKSREQIENEISRLLAAIRRRRDLGDALTASDDLELYEQLPGPLVADFRLPDRGVFLGNCHRFISSRDGNPEMLHEWV